MEGCKENQDEELKKKKKSHSLGNEAENREATSQVEERPGICRLRILRIGNLEIRRPQNDNTLRAKATE